MGDGELGEQQAEAVERALEYRKCGRELFTRLLASGEEQRFGVAGGGGGGGVDVAILMLKNHLCPYRVITYHHPQLEYYFVIVGVGSKENKIKRHR